MSLVRVSGPTVINASHLAGFFHHGVISNMAIKKAVQKAKVIAIKSHEVQELKCLGYDGQKLVLYSKMLNQVVFAKPEQLTPRCQLSICGLVWLKEHFGPGVEGAEPNVFGFDGDMAVQYLVSNCQSAGHYSPSRVRTEGVYRDGDDAIIINTGSELLRVSGNSSSSSHDQLCAYTQVGQGLGLTASTVCASRKDVKDLENFVGNWTFRQPAHPIFLMGWVATAVYAGALERRPHLCATGRRGIGKTMLRDGLGGVFGPAALLVEGSSTIAGISQALDGRPIPVFVDEAEMHAGNSLQGIVHGARSSYSSSGEGRVVGSGSGKSRSAPMSSPFFFTCIQPPTFEASDASRWLMVEVTGLKPEAAANPSRFALDEKYRTEVGARLRMLLVRRWPAFSKSLPIFRSVLLNKLGDARLAETLAAVFAGYWVLKHEGPVTLADAEFLATKLRETVDASKEQPMDEVECLTSLLTKIIAVRSLRGDGKQSVAEIVQRACDDDALADIQLQRLGIRALRRDDGELTLSVPVSTSHRGMHSLFIGTRWARGNWGAVLKRLPGAEGTTQRMLGIATKVIQFPIPVEFVKPVANGEVLKKAA